MSGSKSNRNFNGKGEKAFRFCQTVCGGGDLEVMHEKDAPGTPPAARGSATRSANLTLSISADNESEARRIRKAMATDGCINMPHDKAFWLCWWTSSALIGK